MYHDIEDLIKEVEQFKLNMKDSGQLCELLGEVTKQIETSTVVSKQRSESIINNHQSIVEKQQKDFEQKCLAFLDSAEEILVTCRAQQETLMATNVQNSEAIIDNFQSIIERQQEDFKQRHSSLLASAGEILNACRAQQKTFREKADQFYNRLDKLQVEALSREIGKANTKISILLVCAIMAIIISILSLFL